jgi:hypothetical protein
VCAGTLVHHEPRMRGGVHGRGGGVDRLLKMKIAQVGAHHAIPVTVCL